MTIASAHLYLWLVYQDFKAVSYQVFSSGVVNLNTEVIFPVKNLVSL